jgi:hypothetical protein
MSSDNNSNNSEEDFSEVDNDEQEIIINNNKKSDNVVNIKGNGNLHFLPFKINYTGHCKVDAFFESLIEKKQIDCKNENAQNCKTSFRGRIFNGKKVNINEKFALTHLKLKRKGVINKCAVVVAKNEIKNYYIWKYDEEVPYNNNLLNMEKIMKNLDVLK